MDVIQYRSTRSGTPLVSFEEALLTGLAPDGGLFIPERIPELDPELWQAPASFPDVACHMLQAWLDGEIPPDVLEPIIRDALNFEVPLVALGEESEAYSGLHVLELFHGPTLSFKDFGARTMARLIGHFLASSGGHLTILVATSGDTGSAVADGFAGQPNVNVVLLYPDGGVSPVQERQLIVERPGVRVYAVEGSFDDCQRMVKTAFRDPDLAPLRLSSANSINIGRLLPQATYYVWALGQLGLDRVNFCTPSGNLGNLTGGMLAVEGGLPVNRFIAAHNANDFFPLFLESGSRVQKSTVRTISNAMDVGSPSNFERLHHMLTPEVFEELICGTSVSDEATQSRMKAVYEQTGYVADPHTSVGLEAAIRYRDRTGDPTPIIILGTAHPVKFPDVIQEVLGFEPVAPPQLDGLEGSATAVETLPPKEEALRDALLAI